MYSFNRIVLTFSLLLILGLGSLAEAFQITIDPDSYTGNYRVVGVGVFSGINLVDLNQGTHEVIVGTSTATTRILFDVDGSGNVTSQNTDAATDSGSTLTFNNTIIFVDPVNYTGSWDINGLGFQTGNVALTLVPGVNYQMRIGGSTVTTVFLMDVDGSGNVTSQNTDAAIGVANTLVLNNSTINVDPDGYTGNWEIQGVTGTQQGVVAVTAVPGLSYLIRTIPVNDSQIFNLNEPCAVVPSQFVLEGFTFTVTCQASAPILS